MSASLIDRSGSRAFRPLDRNASGVEASHPGPYLDKLLAEPFEAFTFLPAGAAVYQLGQFGTAAKKLKQLGLKP